MKNHSVLFVASLLIGLGFFASCKTTPKTQDAPSSKSTATSVPGRTTHDGEADVARWKKQPYHHITEAELVDHACDLFASLDVSQNGFLEKSEARSLPAWLNLADRETVNIQDVASAAKAKFKAHAKANPKVLSRSEYAAMEAGR